MQSFSTHDRGVETLQDTLVFMLDLVEKRKCDATNDQLILVQHPSIFTVGRGNQRIQGKAAAAVKPSPTLQPLPLTRGGGITYHDPGQVVGYPIVKLKPNDGFGIDAYLRTLERYLIAVLQSFDSSLHFTTDPRGTGIWLEGKKVASIGIAISGWVTYHGFAINLHADLAQFHKINPCGMDPLVIANVSDFTRVTITVEKLKEKLKDTFRHFFEETTHGKESFGTKNQDPASASGRIA